MSKPYVHARSSAKRWGGKEEDYLPIHEFMDSSKETFSDNRHRCLLHTSFAIKNILPKVFGQTITNSDGREVSVESLGEQHCLEDYGGFIPTVQDFLGELEYQPWMNGLGGPPSAKKINDKRVKIGD